jgi:hypothetical protein
VEVHRPAAYLAVFNVVLHVDGAIDQQVNPFSTIRANDLSFFLIIHKPLQDIGNMAINLIPGITDTSINTFRKKPAKHVAFVPVAVNLSPSPRRGSE